MFSAVQVTGRTRRWFLISEIPERDKMKKPIHRLLLPALLLSCSSLAFAGPVTTYTINFEGVPGYTLLTNQYANGVYASDPVTFFNALELNTGDGNPTGYPPHSGTGEITDAGYGTDAADSIVLTFSEGMSTVSGWYTDPYGVVVTAYDSHGNVISTVDGAAVYGADDEFQIFATSGSDPIASITIGDAQDNIFSETVDDISFTTASTTPVIPEPGSFVLLGTGLLSMAGALRRKFAR
jgi:hypothetical protein